LGDLRERNHLEDKGIDGRIILKWLFKMWDGEGWTGLNWLRLWTLVNFVLNLQVP